LELGQRERNSAREKERERERERLSLTVSGGSPKSSDWVNDRRWNGGRRSGRFAATSNSSGGGSVVVAETGALFFSFYSFCSLLFWRCMVERDEQSEREKQQHREKEEGASLLCGRKRD
jgi:hypothetical protein